MLRLTRVALLAGVALLALAGPVAAHAELVSATPAPNSSVTVAPTELRMTFSEAVDLATFSLALRSSDGSGVAGLGAPASADGLTVTVALPALTPGAYTVTYVIVSADDGHPVEAAYAFLFDPSGLQPPPSATPEFSAPPVDPIGLASRAVALVALLVIIGLHTTWISHRLRREPVIEFPWIVLGVLAVVVIGGLAAYLARAAAALPAQPDAGFSIDVAAAFGSTPFARAMRLATGGGLGLVAVTLIALWRSPQPGSDGPWLAASGTGTLLIVAGMAFAGHAAALGGLVGALVDGLHLLAVGAWLGALPAVGVLLWLARRTGEPGPAAVWAGHSRVALVALPVVIATGLLNSPLVLGDSRAVLASATGNLLLLKATLLAIAAGIGAVNYFLVRRAGFRAVIRLAAAEIGLGLAAVLAATVLVTSNPASAARPAVADPGLGAAHLFADASQSRIHLIVEIPGPGVESYRVTVTDPTTGLDRTNVANVILRFIPPSSASATESSVIVPPSDVPGLYGIRGIFTPLVADWQISVLVQGLGTTDDLVTFPVRVLPELADTPLPPSATGQPLPSVLGLIVGLLPAGAIGWLVPVLLLAAMALLGLVARRRVQRSGGLAVATTVLAVFAVSTGLALTARDAVGAVNQAPPAEATRSNPLTPTQDVLTDGRALYLANCASCHGASGAGDGALAAAEGVRPRDLADVVPELTDGELNWAISTGLAGTRMPAFGTTLLPYERWETVSFLRSQWPAP